MTLHETEAALLRTLTTITTHWADMLTPRSSGSIAGPRGGSATLADDHADTDTDTDRLHRLVSLRREVTECLNGWARVVMDDRPATKALPDGTDAVSLADFLTRHAEWFSGHEAVGDALEELRPLARRVAAASNQPEIGERDEIVVRTVKVGACPTRVNLTENAIYGEAPMICGTAVRIPTRYDDADEVQCAGCGVTDTIMGWVARVVGTPEPVTADNLIRQIHRRRGEVVTEAAIRQWVSRTLIAPVGKDDAGRNLYDAHAVFRALRDRDLLRLGTGA